MMILFDLRLTSGMSCSGTRNRRSIMNLGMRQLGAAPRAMQYG